MANHLPVGSFAPGDLGVHPAAAGAPQQTGEQSFVAAGLVVGLGFVPLQRLLHPDPPVRGDDAGVLAHRNDPFADGIVDGGTAFFLVAAVVGQHAALAARFLRIATCHTSSLFCVTACHMTSCIIKTAAPNGKLGRRFCHARFRRYSSTF